MPKMYRLMRHEGGKPLSLNERNCLGVRLPDSGNPGGLVDITPDSAGMVGFGKDGLSVAPSCHQALLNLPPNRVPERFRRLIPAARGLGDEQVWSMGEGPFMQGYVADKLALYTSDEDNPRHGAICPADLMHVDDYVAALFSTSAQWKIDET